MCGIAGFIDPTSPDLLASCRRMIGTLEHRGPDDAGHWTDVRYGLALGHRRLSILDLSAAGHQPMRSAGGRYVLVFNGEIYNHLTIRGELDAAGCAPRWRGHSDTETLLAAFEAWGVRKTLERLVGMFAIAVWDQERSRLVMARDRAGEKPLYYGRCSSAFLFASELKALRSYPAFRPEIDLDALAEYLRHSYVPDPKSIYRGIRKLLPGTLVEVDEHGYAGEPTAYWSAAEAFERMRRSPFAGSVREAVESLERVLVEAVETQMNADVPVGAFLSGGIDSSLVVSLMQARSRRCVRTFTIGFTEAAYDESRYAREVARHLGTEHTELMVTPAEAMAVIPKLPTIYDEPFGDSSQIPTFLVSQLARRHVTVTLSGDAGDELFGGYTRYSWAKRLQRGFGCLPRPIRHAIAQGIRARPPEFWTGLFRGVTPIVPRSLRNVHFGDKLYKAADVIGASPQELYRRLVSHWESPEKLIIGATESRSRLSEVMEECHDWGFEEDMMYWDFLTYLPGDILVKVDRAAMAVSLESRVPMLDWRVVEFAWSLPLDMRMRGGTGKRILRQLLAKYVPPSLTERPKTGFGVPIDAWLRGPLRDWAEGLLDERRLTRDGILDPTLILDRWRAHLLGTANWAYWLWDILMFQAWWEDQSNARTDVPNIAAAAVHCAA